MEIAIGCDHRGFKVKQQIIEYLKSKKMIVNDHGTFNNESCDYPTYAIRVGEEVAKKNILGIVVCGSGIGVSIAANKVKGVRCALVQSPQEAHLARLHDHANVVAIGADIVNPALINEIINQFLNTEGEGGRHLNRTSLISSYEEKGHL